MGSIVHQGISVALQVYYYSMDVEDCKNGISFAVYLIRCIVSFYQLYMAFKYSNVSFGEFSFEILDSSTSTTSANHQPTPLSGDVWHDASVGHFDVFLV